MSTTAGSGANITCSLAPMLSVRNGARAVEFCKFGIWGSRGLPGGRSHWFGGVSVVNRWRSSGWLMSRPSI